MGPFFSGMGRGFEKNHAAGGHTPLQKILTTSQHLAMFGGYWSIEGGDVTNLICHVTSQDHVIEEYDFMGSSTLLYVTNLPSSVAIGIAVVKIFF